MATPFCEAICAGLIVSAWNKFIMNNNYLWSMCDGNTVNHNIDHDGTSSENSAINTDVEHVHVHTDV